MTEMLMPYMVLIARAKNMKAPPPPRPHTLQRDLRSECRAFLNLEEMKADKAGTARSLLTKALEHLPADKESFRRRRVLVLAHLGEESFVSGRCGRYIYFYSSKDVR